MNVISVTERHIEYCDDCTFFDSYQMCTLSGSLPYVN